MAGTGDFQRAVINLALIPKAVRKELRPALKKAADMVVQDARGRASWSSRIPGAIGVRVNFGAKTEGVAIRVNQKRAPHARPYEGITGGSTFRHPYFGNRERWYTQRTRPFLQPAARAKQGQVRAAVAKVVDDAARRHGFR